jgi:ergothioneine biosynthesis protein EgtB
MKPQVALQTNALLAKLSAVREQTLALARPLSAEDCALQSMPDASPTKWHLAHTTWFFETFVLAPHLPHYRAFHPHFKVLFNSYYNGVGDKHPRAERGLISRPDLATVLAYRAHVDAALQELLQQPLPNELNQTITLGLHHEQQHQELILTDLKHLLSKNPLYPAYQAQWPLVTVAPRASHWVEYPEQMIAIGANADDFCFDNETPHHRRFQPAFALASQPVTHGDYLAFMQDGGYQRPELWLSLGWEMIQSQRLQAPAYWTPLGNSWQTFTLHGAAPIEHHTPVCHVSFFEADAYARWAGARLPTEFEWEHAAKQLPESARQGNFLDSGALHPLALQNPPTDTQPVQLFGDVWEWTQSDYAAYPGYRPAPGAIGEYNGKFMNSQYVLRGGSCATPKRHIRATYRNFFPPQTRWQFSGIRLAQDR